MDHPGHFFQTTDTVMMVRPFKFTYNKDTAEDNYFQNPIEDMSEKDVSAEALQEFDDFVQLLRDNGVEVVVAQDTPDPSTPDSIFPNNWFTTHYNGDLFIYPMYAESRAPESHKTALMRPLQERFKPTRVIDLREYKEQGLLLEGTGSMVLDRTNRVVYACRSERTSEQLVNTFCSKNDFKPIVFDAVDRDGHPIYHTNVMMMISEEFVVVCSETLPDPEEKERMMKYLSRGGRDIIDITMEQVYSFAGNMLGLRNKNGDKLVVMSRQAYDSLTQAQRDAIASHATILAPVLDVIERHGGGSARCMMGEIYPHK